MSRISRYQESIVRFVKTKSSYSDTIKSNIEMENLINTNNHEPSIILLTVLSGLYKKKNMKSHHGYYVASGIDLLMLYVIINDNFTYYENKLEKENLKNILNQTPIHIFECLSQNIETVENSFEKDKITKIYRKINTFVHKKVLEITKYKEFVGIDHVHRTDIIKYKFTDKNIINSKYRKLKIIDKDILIDHIEMTYGSVCQCAFVIGWLLGLGDEKMINNLERLGTHLGFLIKLSRDFKNIERDINYSNNDVSMNLIINYGIHECFALFMESKIKLLEGCLTLDIYNITIKEVIDYIEKGFDCQLKNTNLEMESKYSSFSTNDQ